MDEKVAEPFIVVAGSDSLLRGALPIEPGRVASRRILKAPGARIVRLALDAGQVLSERTAAVPVLVQVLAGRVILDASGESTELAEGAIVYISAQTPHSVEALGKAHLTLTLIDGFDAVHLGEGPDGRRKRTPVTSESRLSASAAHPTTPGTAPAVAPLDAARSPSSLADNVVLAASGPDAAAVDAFTRRHGELSRALATHGAQVLDAAATGDPAALLHARHGLEQWTRRVLLGQLAVEAEVLFAAADALDGGELVGVLRALLDRIGSLLPAVTGHADASESAASAVALRVAVDRLLRTERERLLPLLAASSPRSLAMLWADVERRSAAAT